MVRERCPTTKHRDAAVQRYYDPGTGQFMSLDPLNKMTNAGCTFDKDNPFANSDPTGTMACGAGPYCSSSGADSPHDQASANSLPPPTSSAPPATSGEARSVASANCHSNVDAPPATSTEASCASDGTPYTFPHPQSAPSPGIIHYLDDTRHFLATALDRAGCVAEQFDQIPGTGNGGAELFEGGASSLAVGVFVIVIAAPTGVGEIPAAPIGGTAIVAGGYLIYEGSELIGTACFP
jgi:hypothetical protein